MRVKLYSQFLCISNLFTQVKCHLWITRTLTFLMRPGRIVINIKKVSVRDNYLTRQPEFSSSFALIFSITALTSWSVSVRSYD